MKFLIGSDPELFVKKDSKLVSAFGLIKGDKKNPFKVPFGAVQVDGMALEFNTDPAETSDQFIHNIETVMNALQQMCPEHEFDISPVAMFGKEYIDAQPAEAKELGCDPDYNAWTGMPNPRPNGSLGFRTASGHIHIGWGSNFEAHNSGHIEDCREMGKQMDFYLGLQSLMFDPDTRRRELYGKGGAIRVKPYGVEYRTLSNFWLKDRKLMKWAFDMAQAGAKALVEGRSLAAKYGDVSEIINTSNVKEAQSILKAEGLLVGV